MTRQPLLCSILLLASALPVAQAMPVVDAAANRGGMVQLDESVGSQPRMLSAFAEETSKYIQTPTLRTYPPSCLDVPLPAPNQTEPLIGGPFTARNLAGTQTDNWGVEVFRRPCVGVAGRSVVLVRFRDLSPASDIIPIFPLVQLTQNGITSFARVTRDPRDRLGDVYGSQIVLGTGTTLVVQGALTYTFDQNQPFSILVTYGTGGTSGNVGAYNTGDYPESSLGLLLDGYVSGSYYEPARGGEGLFFEVGERANGNLFVFFSWFTYDAQGFPYWLVGNADIGSNLRSVTIPALALQNGGFAGNFNPANLQVFTWGNITFSFPNCDTVQFQYQSAPTAPAAAPIGTGVRTWQRLSTLNGLPCK